jgi:CheY-like chemotaxis protein
MLRRVIGEDVELAVETPAAPCPVFADPGHLEQVLMNLVVNARDAMPQGGLVSLRTSLDDGHVVLSVADTGHGIPASVRERLFEPFFTTKEVGRGTGLGLSVVHRIIEDAGGRIDVFSEEGHGAEFRITLPRHGAPEPAAVVETRRPPSSGSETILVVEDDDRVRNLIKRMLESRGYQVLDAASPEDALLLLDNPEVRPSVLVSDVVMPRMDGGELAARAATLREGLRVLFVSGYAQDALPNALPDGAAYLHKPFSADALAGKIRSLLDA